MASKIHVGTAGWSIPRADQDRIPAGDSHLGRYAQVFSGVEINSTFHRAHRPATFERWAASVPRAFRFSVKLPKTITHEQRLARSASLLDTFFEEIAPLGQRLGCLLAQLPPSLAFEARTARTFFKNLRARHPGGVALEPRHETWAALQADRLLSEFNIARVAADPPRITEGGEPRGWPGLVYYRLHGSPRPYYSSYDDDYLQSLVAKLDVLRRRRIPTWCIFDNTAHGAATGNALRVVDGLR